MPALPNPMIFVVMCLWAFTVVGCNVERAPIFGPYSYSSQSQTFFRAWRLRQVEINVGSETSYCMNYGQYCSRIDSEYQTQPEDCAAIGIDTEKSSKYFCELYIKDSQGSRVIENRQCLPCASSANNMYRLAIKHVEATDENTNLNSACNTDAQSQKIATVGNLYFLALPDPDLQEYSGAAVSDDAMAISKMTFHDDDKAYCATNFAP